MVKREYLTPGALVKVAKKVAPTAMPGPNFNGTLGLNERLEVITPPRTVGGTNLVTVKRRKTGEEFDALYAFITCFCKPTDE
jgi:hypothetical protein